MAKPLKEIFADDQWTYTNDNKKCLNLSSCGGVNFYRGNVRIELVFGRDLGVWKGDVNFYDASIPVCVITGIVTDKGARGSGFASAALKSILKCLREVGIDRVWVEPCVIGGRRTIPKGLDKAALVAWYEKEGFAKAGPEGNETRIMKLEQPCITSAE